MSEQNNVLYLVIADNMKSAEQLMVSFVFRYMYNLSRVSKADHTVYFTDGRIFKFTSKTSKNSIGRNRRNWNIYSSEAFEEEFLNDSK